MFNQKSASQMKGAKMFALQEFEIIGVKKGENAYKLFYKVMELD